MEREFNLVDEPWICVRMQDCFVRKVSLGDALIHAHEFEDLAGETRTQDFAVIRLLLAAMHTIFTRYDVHGKDVSAEDLDGNAMTDLWLQIYKSGRIPEAPVKKYFEEWHDRFWLFDPKNPFYQTIDADDGRFYNIERMTGTIYESDNKRRIFSERSKEGNYLDYDEAARWLIHMNLFDDRSLKKPTPKKSYGCSIYPVWVRGENLFETLMFNFVVDFPDQEYRGIPSWEKYNRSVEKNACIAMPLNQAELLTVMSRRMLLCPENGKVTKFKVFAGDYIEENLYAEQMTMWRNAGEEIAPKIMWSSSEKKKIWQELDNVLMPVRTGDSEDDVQRMIGVIGWTMKMVNMLVQKGLIGEDRIITVETAAIVTKTDISNTIVDTIHDSLSLHSFLFEKAGNKWLAKAVEEIEKCQKAGNVIFAFCRDLLRTGIEENGDNAKKEEKGKKKSKSPDITLRIAKNAVRDFYAEIDHDVKRWLGNISPDCDEDKYSSEFENMLKGAALRTGMRIISQRQNFSTSTASKEAERFERSINKVFGDAKEEGEKNE